VHTQINANTIQPGSNQYFAVLMDRPGLVRAPVLCERHLRRRPDAMSDGQLIERLSSAFADGFTYAGYM
jgi:hypothetical protein